MRNDEEVAAELAASFEVVHVNTSKENRNTEVLERLGHPEKNGFPVLVVLSPQLEVLHTQETGSLETGSKATPGHDPAKVLEFLRAWKAVR